jgi:hypothetical protein
MGAIALHDATAQLIIDNPNDETRILRAHDMIENGVRVERIDRNYYLVQSATNDETIYILDKTGCPCPDHTHRSVVCKHMWSAMIFYNMQADTNAAHVAA